MRISVEEVYPAHTPQHLNAEGEVILLRHPGAEECETISSASFRS
jgi:hypothetical protein